MSTNQLIYAMLSHRGRVRHANEDACAASSEAGVFVICDGMGGAAAGEVASRLAADTLLAHLAPHARGKNGTGGRGWAGTGQTEYGPECRLGAAIQAANRAVYEQSLHSPRLAGMGTTMVMLMHAPICSDSASGSRRTAVNHGNSRSSDPPTLWLAHVGDSRCYRRRRGVLEQMTGDHSLVEEQMRAGQITAAQALRSPMRNLITRAVGSQAAVEPEIQGHHPQPGDVYLLASDGLTHEVEDEEIAGILGAIPAPSTTAALTTACEELIRTANRNGGSDNITVLLVAVTGS